MPAEAVSRLHLVHVLAAYLRVMRGVLHDSKCIGVWGKYSLSCVIVERKSTITLVVVVMIILVIVTVMLIVMTHGWIMLTVTVMLIVTTDGWV